MTLNRTLIGAIALMTYSHAGYAEDAPPAGLFAATAGKDISGWTGLQQYGLNLGGWATAGINYNTDEPADNSNGPVSMTDRTGEFHLYQLNLFAEKAVSKGDSWDVGGRFDFMFGTDTRYTQATGHWDMGLVSERSLRFYDIALPQAYAEVYAPVGNGLSAKLGHFYTIIGYESVPSPLNFFSSHTYSFKSSPFTTTGALFNYALNDQWNLNLGAVTGADNFDRDFGAFSHMSGLTWTHADTGTSASFSLMQGDVYKHQSSELVYYSAILQQALGNWRYVLQHDRGTQRNAAGQGQNADWYSVVQYLTYQFSDRWGAGLRGEWFRDDDGVRYLAGAANYYAMTAGLNWKPQSWLMIRPEVRYDWSEAQTAPFDGAHRSSQVLLGVDAVVQF